MRFRILSDSHWESRVSDMLSDLAEFDFRAYFDERDYGNGLAGITVVYICQTKELNLKPRIRFVKAEKRLYMDIVLDLDEMKSSEQSDRRNIIITRLKSDIEKTIKKYKFENFNIARFVADLDVWIKRTGWRRRSANMG